MKNAMKNGAEIRAVLVSLAASNQGQSFTCISAEGCIGVPGLQP